MGRRAVRCPRWRPVPVVTGQYRSGDVRHIVADPARAAEVLGLPRGCRSARRAASFRVRAAALEDALGSNGMPNDVTVVLPCLNEEESLPAVLSGHSRRLPGVGGGQQQHR